MSRDAQLGDLYQITEAHGRNGWTGAIVMATKVKPWGIQGFVHVIESNDNCGRAYIRLKWDEIEHVGHAHLIPADEETP